ncbi:hypothetical protein FQN57_004128 [Myotisia sp. PD_48]|nr:hypothetical protein FQN57_004128 [Myotisia sp. PD_48]
MCMYSSGRVGEYVESTARHGEGRGLHIPEDLTFIVIRNCKGKPEILCAPRRDAKNMTNKEGKRPLHPMQEDIESEPLYLNPVLEPLVMCLARGLFRDFETVDEIFALEPSKGECYELALSTSEEQQTPKRHASFCSAGDYPQSQTAFLLNVNPCARPAGRTPFFEKMSGSGPTGQILGATWLNDELGRLGRRAGYDRKISIHDLRAEALVRADGEIQSDQPISEML